MRCRVLDVNEIGKDICSLKEGDIKSFEALNKHYHGMILNYILKHGFSTGTFFTRDDAEMICDDVFVQIWEKREIIKTSSLDYKEVENSFRNWLFHVTRNYKIPDFIKKNKKYMKETSLNNKNETSWLEIIPDGNIGFDKKILINQLKEILPRLFSLLNDEEKDVIHFRFWTDRTYKEIADILSNEELNEEENEREAVRLKTIAHRALEKFKKYLDQNSQDKRLFELFWEELKL